MQIRIFNTHIPREETSSGIANKTEEGRWVSMLLSMAGLFEDVRSGIKSSYIIQTRPRKADWETWIWNFLQLAVYMLSHHTIYMI